MGILSITLAEISDRTAIIVAIIGAVATILAVIIPLIKRIKLKHEKERELAAEQIKQCLVLIRFIPTWLMAENEYDAIPADASDSELKIVSTKLSLFIHSSIIDHWSAAFFKTNYDKIPVIEAHIQLFRNKIQEFYNDLLSASKNQALLKIAWGAGLREELFNLRVEALKINEEATAEHDRCVVKMQK
jgi:hypothetical protein